MSLITSEFAQRVPTVNLIDPAPGKSFYRLTHAEYVPDGARRFGPDHHILVDVWDENGNRLQNVPVIFEWQGGAQSTLTNKTSGPYAVDFAMYAAGHSYGVRVGELGRDSDSVFGMGLGKIGNIHQGHHVSYFLVFQRVEADDIATPPLPPPNGSDEWRVEVERLALELLALAQGE